MPASTFQVIETLGGCRKTAAKIGVSKSHVHRMAATGEVLNLRHALKLTAAFLPADAGAAEQLAQLHALAGLAADASA